MTREELKAMHQAGRKKSVLDDVTKRFGCNCANCGSSENIRYHHIVPLSVGGTNNSTNIVPLCLQCHLNLHAGIIVDVSKYANMGGRKRKEPSEEAKTAFIDFINCKIPRCEAEKIMGQRVDSSRENNWRGEIKKSLGIIQFHNNIGVKLSKTGFLAKGEPTGWIKYDGIELPVMVIADRNYYAESYGIEVHTNKSRYATVL